MYRHAFEQFGDSPNAVFWPKGRQWERFNSLTSQIKIDNFSLLDYGCGLGHLFTFLQDRFSTFSYTGVDIVDEFIAQNKSKYPTSKFLKINDFGDVKNNYDFITIAGVFNILYTNLNDHKKIVFNTIKHLFEYTNIALSINFMTDLVDFKSENSYHQNIPEIFEFACNHLSKRLIIDQSYMPYEFTITIFKDAEIIRPANIYNILK